MFRNQKYRHDFFFQILFSGNSPKSGCGRKWVKYMLWIHINTISFLISSFELTDVSEFIQYILEVFSPYTSRKFYINHRRDRNFKLGPIYHYKFTNFILLMNFNGELSDHLFGRIPRYVDFNIFFKYKYIPFNIAISIPGRFSFFYYICLKVSLLRS